MFCLYCGAKIPQDALFCNNCGKAQSGVQGAQVGEGAAKSSQPPVEQTSMAPESPPASQVPIVHEAPPVVEDALSLPDISRRDVPPTFSAPTSPPKLGYYITGGAGILALSAFFFMPYLSLGIFTATGQQLASDGNQYGGQFGQLQLLWLEPLFAASVVGISAYQLYRNGQGNLSELVDKRWAIGLIALATLTLIVLFIRYAIDAQPPADQTASTVTTLASLYSSGFWVYIVSMIGVIIGGIVQIKQA